MKLPPGPYSPRYNRSRYRIKAGKIILDGLGLNTLDRASALADALNEREALIRVAREVVKTRCWIMEARSHPSVVALDKALAALPPGLLDEAAPTTPRTK